MRSIRKLLITLYVGIACLTLASQSVTRLPLCTGNAACTVSLAKGAIWSGAWPAYWTIYSYNWISQEPTASAANIAVDEEWYLSEYPDVRAAVQAGQFKSAADHYRNNGFKEKRLPAKPKVDEDYYLRSNADVANAVRSGQFKSGYEHYIKFGHLEGRKPSP